MKKNSLWVIGSICLAGFFIHSCKKDASAPPTHIGTTTSFTEEFDSVYKLGAKGWVVQDNSSSAPGSSISAPWNQGYGSYDKGGIWYGFSAYSYLISDDEFAYSRISGNANLGVSSWLISPVLSVKNGDKISFYSRADTTGTYSNRMQVRISQSSTVDLGIATSTVGGFSNLLFDINPTQSGGGYPVTWTKYEYTFSGLSGNIDVRVGFRHFMTSATNCHGIGIDQFRFQVN